MIDLADTLDALGLSGKCFSLSKKVNGALKSGCFSSVASGERWLGDGETDCYIMANSVREGTTGKPSDADIESVKILLVDVDPRKDSESDPTGTSQERMDAAWDVATGVWEHFDQKGILVASGRGAQVWLRVEFGIDRRALLAWIRDEFAHPLIDIDATHDYSRLVRLPNTVNTRTQEIVALIDEGVETPVSGADVRDLLASWAPPAQFDLPEVDRDAPSGREIRRYVSGEALTLWREDPMEITRDRSQRDFIFLRLVIARGAPLAVASRLLHALPGSKACERHDEGYWVSTVGAALTSLADERQSDDVIANVITRVEADEDYLMQPETIKALARVYATDFEKWVVLRAALKPLAKRQGLGIGDLDKVVKKRAASIADTEALPPDGTVIFTRAEDGGKGSWKVRDVKGKWTWASLFEAKMVLSAEQGDPGADMALAMTNPFAVGLSPFKPRILPGRTWNESNARFSVAPAEGPHPTWDQMHDVVGRGLDNDLVGCAWAQKHGVTTGGTYLRWWVASMLQDPRSRRAYLFLFSPEQGTGKSLFFEALSFLIGRALCRADNGLRSEAGFNGEWANAVCCYTEEIDLGANGRTKIYDKVKDVTLGRTIAIHAKGGQVYEVPNVTSWGQNANSQSYCPVYKGDDRITVFQVFPPLDSERMSKDVMLGQLEAEAPAMLYTLLNLPMPAPEGRYTVPPIQTEVKSLQAKANQDDLKDWLSVRPGWILMPLNEVIDSFRAYLESRGLAAKFWTPQRIRRELPFIGCRTRDLWDRIRHESIEDMTAGDIKDAFGLTDPSARLGKSLAALEKVAPEFTRRVARGCSRYTLATNG